MFKVVQQKTNKNTASISLRKKITLSEIGRENKIKRKSDIAWPPLYAKEKDKRSLSQCNITLISQPERQIMEQIDAAKRYAKNAKRHKFKT